MNHGLTMVCEYKQHLSGQGLVTACLAALMDNVEIPKDTSFLYTDAFGYDGCLAAVVLAANARDPRTIRSCITICQDIENQSYITNLVGTAVFNMAKTKELAVLDFPDLQGIVDTCHLPSLDPRLSLTLDATVYLPGMRVLAVKARHVKRWAMDQTHGEEP